MLFTVRQARIFQYCAEEVERQRANAIEVYDMFRAWQYLHVMVENPYRVTVEVIENLGRLVDPTDNWNGFRTFPVLVPNGQTVHHTLIVRSLETVLDAYNGTEEYADWMYRQTMEIHPFKDGNGRVGSLLYNYFHDTLEEPIAPPIFWS